jgi:hypothetical protein
METLQTLSTLKSPEGLARMSHGAPATWAISWQRIRFSSPRTRSDPVRVRIFRPEATAAGATLAPWFRCGWLVRRRRSLRLFGPSWRGCPDAFPLATFMSTSQPRLRTTGNSLARRPADGAFDAASELTQQKWLGNCDTAGIMTPLPLDFCVACATARPTQSALLWTC